MEARISFFHFHASTIRRSRFQSAVAAAAYISGTVLHDLRQGVTHDYSPRARAKSIYDCEIVHPVGAEWCRSRERLWNAAELAEGRRNSVTGRQIEFALPALLPPPRMSAISREVATFLRDRFEVAVDMAIHCPRETNSNWHTHLQMTTRQVTADGLGAKTRILDVARTGGPEIVAIRAECARLLNRELRAIGIAEELSHLSFAARGIDRIPQVKLGKRAAAHKRRGGVGARETLNILIRETNRLGDAVRRDLAEAAQLQREIDAGTAMLAAFPPPDLWSTERRGRGRRHRRSPPYLQQHVHRRPSPSADAASLEGARCRPSHLEVAFDADLALAAFVSMVQQRAAAHPGGLDGAGLLGMVAGIAAEARQPGQTKAVLQDGRHSPSEAPLPGATRTTARGQARKAWGPSVSETLAELLWPTGRQHPVPPAVALLVRVQGAGVHCRVSEAGDHSRAWVAFDMLDGLLDAETDKGSLGLLGVIEVAGQSSRMCKARMSTRRLGAAPSGAVVNRPTLYVPLGRADLVALKPTISNDAKASPPPVAQFDPVPAMPPPAVAPKSVAEPGIRATPPQQTVPTSSGAVRAVQPDHPMLHAPSKAERAPLRPHLLDLAFQAGLISHPPPPLGTVSRTAHPQVAQTQVAPAPARPEVIPPARMTPKPQRDFGHLRNEAPPVGSPVSAVVQSTVISSAAPVAIMPRVLPSLTDRTPYPEEMSAHRVQPEGVIPSRDDQAPLTDTPVHRQTPASQGKLASPAVSLPPARQLERAVTVETGPGLGQPFDQAPTPEKQGGHAVKPPVTAVPTAVAPFPDVGSAPSETSETDRKAAADRRRRAIRAPQGPDIDDR